MDSPAATIRAHQYLYYVKCRPVLSDRDYDELCKFHGLEGGGGSDRACDYTLAEIELADKIAAGGNYRPILRESA